LEEETCLTLAVLGQEPDLSLLVERIPGYLQTFLLTAVIFGGQEELGWRGYALPRLEQRHAPLVATLILGLARGVWHIPLDGAAGFVVPLVLAFFYSWLYNRTQSVLLCILLHASLTPAQDHLLLPQIRRWSMLCYSVPTSLRPGWSLRLPVGGSACHLPNLDRDYRALSVAETVVADGTGDEPANAHMFLRAYHE
jgi:hypothetical protein